MMGRTPDEVDVRRNNGWQLSLCQLTRGWTVQSARDVGPDPCLRTRDLSHLAENAHRHLGGKPQRHLIVLGHRGQQLGNALPADVGTRIPDLSAGSSPSWSAS
jgi:hypothetical protein